MYQEESKEKGITLVALVITIIVFLILSGVTIAALSGDNGILKRATEAKEKTQQAQEFEEETLGIMEDMVNGTGTLGSVWYDLYTGQGPKSSNDESSYSYDVTHNYSIPNGVLASTTKNVTGVYDMAGGAWERVAGYLDNRNVNLNTYGKSEDGSVKYFENGELKSEYQNIWDKYEVSEEERNNKVTLSDGTIEAELWNLCGGFVF